MTDDFDAKKTRAAAWFRSLRDEIVDAFEALEAAPGPNSRPPPAASPSARPAAPARTAPTPAAA